MRWTERLARKPRSCVASDHVQHWRTCFRTYPHENAGKYRSPHRRWFSCMEKAGRIGVFHYGLRLPRCWSIGSACCTPMRMHSRFRLCISPRCQRTPWIACLGVRSRSHPKVSRSGAKECHPARHSARFGILHHLSEFVHSKGNCP